MLNKHAPKKTVLFFLNHTPNFNKKICKATMKRQQIIKQSKLELEVFKSFKKHLIL